MQILENTEKLKKIGLVLTTHSNTAHASKGLENKQLQLETTFAKSHNTMEIQRGRGGGGARVAGDAGRSAGALVGAFGRNSVQVAVAPPPPAASRQPMKTSSRSSPRVASQSK